MGWWESVRMLILSLLLQACLSCSGVVTLLRRRWNQFSTTIPIDSNSLQATWSKSDFLVIICQTIYPRIFRRDESRCKNGAFSITKREEVDGLRCFLHCYKKDDFREVCVLWSPLSANICEAENTWLVCVLALVLADHLLVALRGCFSTLFKVSS